MKKLCVMVLLALAIAAPSARAQNAAPDPAQVVPANVRFDVVITDDNGGGKPLTKTVTLNVIAAVNRNDAGTGQIRSSARPPGAPVVQTADGKGFVPNELTLNVDIVQPRLMTGNHVRVPITVEYKPYSAEPKAVSATVRASVDMLMDNGKKTVISQSADPVTERKVIIEVTATIQR